MPSSPSAVAWRRRLSVSIVNSTSDRPASSRGVSAQPSPASISGCAFAWRAVPARHVVARVGSRCAIPAPIAPRPAKPTRSMSLNMRAQSKVGWFGSGRVLHHQA